jgi:hypothetical protein
MIIHEFGHIWDNNSKRPTGGHGEVVDGGRDASIYGGGAGDQLMNFINAKPKYGYRFIGGIKYGKFQ